MASDEEHVARVGESFRDRTYAIFRRDRARDLGRQLVEVREHLGDLLRELRSPDLRQVEGDELLCDHLRGERLRGGDPDLRSGVGVEDAVGLTRERRPHRVRHREHLRTLPRRVAGRLEGVDRLPALTDGQREGVRTEHRVAIPELAGDLDLDRDPGPMLDRVLGDEPRMEGRAARDHEDLRHLTQDVVGNTELVELKTAGMDPPGEGVPDRRRLLVDLLAHEVRVAALLRFGDVPFDLDRMQRDLGSLEIHERDAFACDRDDPSFVDRHDGRAIRVIGPEEGWDIGREHRLPVVPHGHDQR